MNFQAAELFFVALDLASREVVQYAQCERSTPAHVQVCDELAKTGVLVLALDREPLGECQAETAYLALLGIHMGG